MSRCKKLIKNGFTFIEMMVIIILLSVIFVVGISYFSNIIDDAKIAATVDEMRNIANVLPVLQKVLLTDSNRAVKITTINSLQTVVNPTAKNKFNNDYYVKVGSTLAVITSIPITNINPIGAHKVESSANATTITVYPRSKIGKVVSLRKAWIERFFLNKSDVANRVTNQGSFSADYDVNQ